MIFNTLFNKIYVINLEKSTDRREHIIKEFTHPIRNIFVKR